MGLQEGEVGWLREARPENDIVDHGKVEGWDEETLAFSFTLVTLRPSGT